MKYYFTIIKKELIEVIRDKNSFLMSLILMLIMPAIIIGYGIQSGEKNEKILIAERAKNIEMLIEKTDIPYEIMKYNNIEEVIKDKKTYVGIDYLDNKYIVSYYESGISVVQDINKLLKLQIIDSSEVGGKQILYKEHTSENTEATNDLAMVIPILLLLSIMTGNGNGVAVNTFTGEKERGSFETLLLTQVKRSTLFFAKLTTVALSMITGAIAYVIAILAAIKYINAKGRIYISELGIWNICVLIICLVVFSLFIATYVSVIALKAHNVREAQLSTMFLSFIACGLGVTLNSGLMQVNRNIISMIPIVNVMRVLENLFKGNVNIEVIAITNIINIVFIWIGIKIGTHIMNKN